MSIKGLDKVKDAAYASNTNLSLKTITELELEWSDVFDGSRNEVSEKKVLGELKPHGDKLKKLSIMSYGGGVFPNWVGDPSFHQLVYVSIDGCRNCVSLSSLAQLRSLKELYISNMNEVKVVGSEILGTTADVFPSLEILHFINMKAWEVWSTNSGVVFPRLQKLLISGCPNLIKVSFKSIPSLRDVSIEKCGYVVLRSLVFEDSAITKLHIREISGLTDGTWKGVMMNLRAVEELKVDDCNEIRYLWGSEAEASKLLVNLRKLIVGYCSKLVSLEEEEGNCGNNILTSLRMLDIYNCESMKHIICGNSIESLSISWCMSMTYVICGNSIGSLYISVCSSLTSVSFPRAATRGDEQKRNLKSLSIIGCDKLLTIKELGGGENINTNTSSTKMEMLEYVYIEGWKNLNSINELCSIHLTKLMISNCPNLESIPDWEFLNLTSLKHLIIRNCPIDACFPRGNWPPKLSTLQIGELKKPISEWGNQNFPTSLVELRLFGTGDDEECNNISQLSNLIPTSLTSLHIWEFVKLETVSMGLQHLTSLQHLTIRYCQKIKDLPETLLPSLLSLEIYGCPELKERSRGRDSHYWPLISHIPHIYIAD